MNRLKRLESYNGVQHLFRTSSDLIIADAQTPSEWKSPVGIKHSFSDDLSIFGSYHDGIARGKSKKWTQLRNLDGKSRPGERLQRIENIGHTPFYLIAPPNA